MSSTLQCSYGVSAGNWSRLFWIPVAALMLTVMPAKADTVKISVLSSPRAAIFVNGVATGENTDTSINAPISDEVAIEARAQGYVTASKTVKLTAADDNKKIIDFGALMPSGLSAEARKQLDVLKYIVSDISEGAAPEQRQELFREYLKESDTYLKLNAPDVFDVWTIRAIAAMELNHSKTAWEAGQKLLALGPEKANNPNTTLAIAKLKERGWLESQPPTDSKPVVGKAWDNSLGMKFIPVPGVPVLFCVWQTRVRDYKVFSESATAVDTHWKNASYRGAPVSPGENFPVVSVSWDDATAFCNWLTRKERDEARLTDKDSYRLPTDMEWSAAVGLEEESGETPEMRASNGRWSKKGRYAWGPKWPPPDGAGNLADQTLRESFSDAITVDGYRDGFATTAPVGSFPPNSLGLFDIGTNVREWCQDCFSPAPSDLEKRVQRGVSWLYYDKKPKELLASNRDDVTRMAHAETTGFRCVLVVGAQ